MNKKYLYLIIVLIVVAAVSFGYYLNKNKSAEGPVDNSQQQGNEQQENNVESEANKSLREKTLEYAAKANEGKLQEALDGYLSLLKGNPDDLLLLNNIADLYSDMSNWTKAEEYYKKLLGARPDFIQGYRMLAYLYQYRFNDDEEKIKELIDDGLSKNNNNQDLLSWIIDYYQQKGEGEKALPYSKLLVNQLNEQ